MLVAAFQLHIDHGRWWLALGGGASLLYGALLAVAPMIGAVVLTPGGSVPTHWSSASPCWRSPCGCAASSPRAECSQTFTNTRWTLTTVGLMFQDSCRILGAAMRGTFKAICCARGAGSTVRRRLGRGRPGGKAGNRAQARCSRGRCRGPDFRQSAEAADQAAERAYGDARRPQAARPQHRLHTQPIYNPASGSYDHVYLRSYNGTDVDPNAPFVAPSIEVKPGDKLTIALHNKLPRSSASFRPTSRRS